MAVSVGRTIKQLQDLADELNIEIIGTGKDGKKKKEDYIYPIRDYYLLKRYGSKDSLPKHLELMLKLKSPMLAGRIDGFKQEQQDEVWGSSDWMFEHKLNGVRCLVVNTGDGVLHLYSRHNSVTDLLPIAMTDNILLPSDFNVAKLKSSFIVDCEVTSDNPSICTIVSDDLGVETGTQLQAVTAILGSLPDRAIQIQRNNNLFLTFNVFDCLYYDGKWILDDTLRERRVVMDKVIQELEGSGFNVKRVPYTNDKKKEFVQQLFDLGFEGAVAKNWNSKYTPDTTRNFSGWVKIKRSLKSSLLTAEFDVKTALGPMASTSFDGDFIGSLFADTVDVFVTGFERGTKGSAFENLVGSVCVSAYVQKDDGTLEERELGKFSGILLDERQRMTEMVDGEPTLRPDYYHRCVEVDAQQVTSHGRFQHCVFVRWRDDKFPTDCVISENFLRKNLV